MEDVLPVGYRFHPSKEELVNYYLKWRVRRHLPLLPRIIPDVDICSCDPWKLPSIFHGKSIIGRDKQVQKWWFFSLHAPQKVTRSTPSGYWKKTGEDKKVREKETGTVIGTKKILVFYEGQGKNGVKTNYVVHEYHLHGDDFDRTHVLCRLKLKRDKKDESYLGNITLADLELDYDHESSFLEDLVQAGMNSLREFILPENQLQPALGGSQNNSFPSDIHQLTNTDDPSGMDTSLDNEDVGDVQFAALAYAEVLGHKERGSAGNSTKKTNKENEYAGEKSNSVAASTGTTSESTKTSTNPPLANLVNVLFGIFLLLTITRQVLNSDFHCLFALSATQHD